MSAQRFFAVALIGIQAATIAYLSQLPVMPAFLFTLAFLGLFIRKGMTLTRRREQHLYLLVIVAFLAKHIVLPQSFRPMALSYATPLSYTVAQCVLALQVIQLFLKRPHDQLPNALPGLAALTMACATNIVVRYDERFVTQVLVATFIPMAAFYAASCRRRIPSAGKQRRATRAFALLVLMGTAAGAGWMSASGLHSNARGLEDLLGWAGRRSSGSATVGFSGKAKLDGIQLQKEMGADEIALTVYSDSNPGYLRGRIFDYYEDGEWHIAAGSRVLPIANPAPDAMDRTNESETIFLTLDEKSYERAQSHLDEGSRMECWPDVGLGGNVFSPLGCAYFQADTRSATANGHGIVDSSDLPGGFPFSLYVLREQPRVGLWNVDRQQLLILPKTLDPRVRALAAKLFADCHTTEDKIAAVENYFHSNYHYQIGISVPRNSDPLNYFLLDRPPAHCEYFASGAALLLRLGKVPTRYVTGFVTAEHNDIGDSWVAHNRDAHAWLEAFDDERGWTIVEATPASGQPQEQQASAIRQFWDQLRGKLTIFRFRFDQGGMTWLLATAWEKLVGSSGMVLGCTIALAVFISAIWIASHRRTTLQVDERVLAMQKLLSRMDHRTFKQWKLRRAQGETLHQFAHRLRNVAANKDSLRDEAKSALAKARRQQLAHWYEQYAALRYSSRFDEARIATLKAAI